MLKKLIDIINPPVKWKIPVYMMLSVFIGIAAFVFYLSNAASYLNDEPETCTNCHVMYPYYTSWQHSSHGRVAVCNDCHVPHDNLVRKYLFKANDG
ncbi:MAG: NapC/NirT family cytochrome c, partial [Bacteroidota bacterium]